MASGMKQIEAIIRKEKVPDVDKALRAIGVGGVTMIDDVMGRGRDKLIVTSYARGKWTFTSDYIAHSILVTIVKEDDVEKVASAIMKAASTSKVGDGMIYVSPVEEAIDISSGDTIDHKLSK